MRFFRSLVLGVVVLVVGVGGVAWAQGGVGGLSSGSRGVVVRSAEVGSLGGGLSVGQGGGLSWSVPLDFAGGVGGSGLSLSYESGVGSRLLGAGFSVGGVSVIDRCRLSAGVDGVVRGVRLDGGDALCLDGERLVVVSGSVGSDGAVYAKREDDGTRVIADGVAATALSSFEVVSPGGSRSWFGLSGARVVSGGGVPLQWWVSRETDVSGNETRFSYESTAAGAGSFGSDQRLAAVTFGANGAAKVGVARELRFSYWDVKKLAPNAPDGLSLVAGGFVGGQRFGGSSLLKRVSFVVGGKDAGSVRVRYQGEGAADEAQVPSPQGVSGAYRVDSLERCDAQDVCLPRTVFSWQSAPSGWSVRDDVAFAGEPFYADPKAKGQHVLGQTWGDFDGNGTSDLLAATDGVGGQLSGWEFWPTQGTGFAGVSGTGVAVGFHKPWKAELTIKPEIDALLKPPSSYWRGSLAPPVSVVELGSDAAQELLVGESAKRVANVGQLPPYGLGRATDQDAKGTATGSDDFSDHPGLLDGLSVVQRRANGTWSSTSLGYEASSRAGHKILWSQAGQFDGLHGSDVMVCASRVDFDEWYEQHGAEKQFDAHGQDPFLAGELFYALSDADGKLSLADGGKPVGGSCGYDDWRYEGAMFGDGREQVLSVPARRVDGRVLPLADRVTSYGAWSWENGKWSWSDSGLVRDDFMRLRTPGNDKAIFDPSDHHEIMEAGFAPRAGFGIGSARRGDFNGDGIVDFATVELPAGSKSYPAKFLDSGLGSQITFPELLEEKSVVRVWAGTGTGYQRLKASTGDQTFAYPWEWLFEFSGGATTSDVTGDGLDDVVMVKPDLQLVKDPWVWDAKAAEWTLPEDLVPSGDSTVLKGTPAGLRYGGKVATIKHQAFWDPNQIGREYAMVPLDLDRDGSVDLAQFDSQSRHWVFALRAPEKLNTEIGAQSTFPGDRLVGIVDGTGAHTAIDWTTASDPAVSLSKDAPLSWPLRNTPSPEPVVSRVKVDNGLGDGEQWQGRVTQYRYGDRRTDVVTQQALGVRLQAATTTVKTPSGTVQTEVTSRYDNATFDKKLKSYPLLGAPLSVVTVTRDLSDPETPVRVKQEGSRWSWQTTTAQGTHRRAVTERTHGSWDLLKPLTAESQACLVAAFSDAASCLPKGGYHALGGSHTTFGSDKYGNVYDETTEFDDGRTSSVHRDFKNYLGLDDRMIGLVTAETTASLTENGNEYRMVRYEYDSRHRLVATIVEPTRPALRRKSMTVYNQVGMPTHVLRQAGEKLPQLMVHNQYAADQRTLLSSKNSKGQITKTVWQPQLGVPVAVTDPAGITTVTDVDGFGRVMGTQTFVGDKPRAAKATVALARIEGPKGPFTQVTSSVEGAGVISVSKINRVGQKVAEQKAGLGGNVVQLSRYDAQGRIISQSTPTRPGKTPAGWSHISYDLLDRPLDATDAAGRTTKNRYSSAENQLITRQIDAVGRSRYSYSDAYGRVTRAVRDKGPNGSMDPWCFSYGAFDTLIRAADCVDDKLVDTMQYDPLGRQTAHTSTQGLKQQTSYDAYGRVVSTKDATGQISSVSYDVLDRPVKTIDDDGGPDQAVNTYTYDQQFPGSADSNTRVAKDLATDEKDDTHTVTDSTSYDMLRRPVQTARKIDNQPLLTAKTTYDARGLLASTTAPTAAGVPALTVKYHYDAHDALDGLSIPSPNKPGLDLDVWHADKADEFGTITDQHWFNHTSTETQLDTLTGDPVSMVTRHGEKHVMSDLWDFYDDGRIKRHTVNTQQATNRDTYTYDANKQLRSWTTTRPDNTIQTSTITTDTIGNITESPAGTYSYNDHQVLEQVTNAATGTTKYERDDAARLTVRTHVSPDDQIDRVTKLTYDPAGMIAAVRTSTPANKNQPDQTTAIVYNTGGEQALQTTPAAQIRQLQNTAITTAKKNGKQHTTIATTINGPDGPVAAHTTTVTGNEPPTTQLQAIHPGDLQGTTTLTTSDKGDPSYHHYNPFGQATDPANWTASLNTDNPDPAKSSPNTGYTGHDPKTLDGLINMRARLYDPQIGVFQQLDTATTDPGNPADYNRTTYVRNDWPNNTDPSGHNTQPNQHNNPGIPDPGPSAGVAADLNVIGGDPIDLAQMIDSWLASYDINIDFGGAGKFFNVGTAGKLATSILDWAAQPNAYEESTSTTRWAEAFGGGSGKQQVMDCPTNPCEPASGPSAFGWRGMASSIVDYALKDENVIQSPKALNTPAPGLIKNAGKKGKQSAGFKLEKTIDGKVVGMSYKGLDPSDGFSARMGIYQAEPHTMAIRVSDVGPGSLSPELMFKMAVKHLQPEAIRVKWDLYNNTAPGSPARAALVSRFGEMRNNATNNWNEYHGVARGFRDYAAARLTWTGRQAGSFGYTGVEIPAQTDHWMRVVFSKPWGD